MLEISDNLGIDFYIWDYIKGKYVFELNIGAGHERACHFKKINRKNAKSKFSLLEHSPPIDTYHSTNSNTRLYKSLVLLLSELFGARKVTNSNNLRTKNNLEKLEREGANM